MRVIPYRIKARLWKLSVAGMSVGAHLTRYSMYERLGVVGRELPFRDGRVLCISHSKSLCRRMGISEANVTEAEYPTESLLSLSFGTESFDFILSDQVLEHLEGDPQGAFDESWRVLRPGGIMIHTTVFIYPIHGSPGDYWRFTPDALRLLARKFSSIVECGGWGNFDAWRIVRSGMPEVGVPHARWHPLNRIATRNESSWPIMTWIVAQK